MSQSNPQLVTHLVVSPCADAIDFYKKAFGFEELSRMPTPDGKIIHAALALNGHQLFLCDEFDMDQYSHTPKALKGTTCMINLLVDDAAPVFQRAVDAGVTVAMPLEKTFWGAIYGQVEDPFGHRWAFNQQVSELSPEQMKANLEAEIAKA